MKEKVLTFIIGFLVGAIVATGAFFIYEHIKPKNEQNNFEQVRQNGRFNGQMPPDMQQQDNSNIEEGANQTNGTKNQKNSGKQGGRKGNFEGTQNSNGEPPQIPNNNGQNPPDVPNNAQTQQTT